MLKNKRIFYRSHAVQNVNSSLFHFKTIHHMHTMLMYQCFFTRYLWSLAEYITLRLCTEHYSDVIMSAIGSQITGVSIVCSTVCSSADQRKHKSWRLWGGFTGVRWIPLTKSVTRKRFSFDDVITTWIFWGSLMAEVSLMTSALRWWSRNMGLLPDTKKMRVRMRRECRERFPRRRGQAIPTCITARAWRTCRDACRDR